MTPAHPASALDDLLRRLGPLGPPRLRAFDPSSDGRDRAYVPVSEHELDALSQGGAFALDGRAVVLYPDRLGHSNSNPKYHLTACASLRQTRDDDRRRGISPRYRATRSACPDLLVERVQGLYSGRPVSLGEQRVSFSPCRECLHELQIGGYRKCSRLNWRQTRRNERVEAAFDLAGHLEERQANPDAAPAALPLANGNGAAKSTKALDGAYRSSSRPYWNALKVMADYTCEECGVPLAALRPAFTVHHRNRKKKDDRRANLALLCIGCHSLQEGAGHRKLVQTPEFQEFAERFPDHRAVVATHRS